MSDGFVRIPQDSTGKRIDASELTVGANVVERQRIIIADSTDSAGLTVVKDVDPSSSEYGIVTRNIPSATPTPIEVKTVSNSSVTSVASSATNVTLLAANSNRKGATFYNDSTKILYLKMGATASTSSFTIKMAANSYFELPLPCYTGIIDGLWSNVNGAVNVTEFT